MAFRQHGPTDYVNVQRTAFTTKRANRNLHLLQGTSSEVQGPSLGVPECPGAAGGDRRARSGAYMNKRERSLSPSSAPPFSSQSWPSPHSPGTNSRRGTFFRLSTQSSPS